MKMSNSSSHVIEGRFEGRAKAKGKDNKSGHSQPVKEKLIRNDQVGG